MPYSIRVATKHLLHLHADLGLTPQDALVLARNAQSYEQLRHGAKKLRTHLEKGWGSELFDFASLSRVYPSSSVRSWARLTRRLHKSCLAKVPDCAMTLEDAKGIVARARIDAVGASSAYAHVKSTMRQQMDALYAHLRSGDPLDTFMTHARGYMLQSKRPQHVIPPDVIRRVIAQYGALNTHFAECDVPYSPTSRHLRAAFPLEKVTFINAPHSRLKRTKKAGIGWVEKCHLQAQRGADVVMMLPARTDTAWFHDIILAHRYKITFLSGRLRFCNTKGSAPFPSMLVHMTKTADDGDDAGDDAGDDES